MRHPDFVEVYDTSSTRGIRRKLIARFDAIRQVGHGVTGSGVDVAVKDSWDITLNVHPEWADALQLLNEAVFAGLNRYLRRYPHLVLAPTQLKSSDPATGALVALDAERLVAGDDATLGSILMTLFRPGSINLQKYLADQGAYPYWHCEHYPSPAFDNAESLDRSRLWTIYRNHGFVAGETECPYQGRKIVPKTSSLLIAPTAFKHTHRGNMQKGRGQVHRNQLDSLQSLRGDLSQGACGEVTGRVRRRDASRRHAPARFTNSSMRAASVSRLNGLVSTCMSWSRWPLPITALSA